MLNQGMMNTKEQIAKGKLLIAEPFMIDPNFKRSAILLCEHDGEGTLGYILNKKLHSRVDELVDDFPEFASQVYFGGPVQTDTLHFIHRAGELLEGSSPIMPGLWLGGDFEQLKFLINTQVIQPNDIRFFLGYAGWTGGQLAEEMDYGSWITADMDINYLFKISADTLWRVAMMHKGNAFAVMSQLPEELLWN
jgi:putative transcriptional regulator